MPTARALFDSYQRLTPSFIRNAVPSWGKVPVLSALYRQTLHPDIAFLLARHLDKLERTGHGRLRRRLAPAGFQDIGDPLFQASVVLSHPTGKSRALNLEAGRFAIEFGYFGLKVMAWVPTAGAGSADMVRAQILVDGTVVRAERLGISSDGRMARLRYVIKRPALDLFPRQCQISILTEQGLAFTNGGGGTSIGLNLPFAKGGIAERLSATGPLDKKGNLRPTATELLHRQDGYLDLYAKVRAAFDAEFGKPLFLLYGTLLGQHRSGDFIPGDDDFDVGYVSEAKTPDDVRLEAIHIIERLVARGFTVAVNREGKPFRIRSDDDGAELHLDNRPVFSLGDGHVWMHKHARLPLSLQSFRAISTGTMRGREILRPQGTEEFLAAYYGQNWRTPDPGFTNAAAGVPAEISDTLAQVFLSRDEQRDLIEKTKPMDGRFLSTALFPPYPIDAYASNIGW